MKDRHVGKELSEYIDGMLSEEEASSVKEHLDGCPRCMEEYKSMIEIIRHMNEMERLETPEFFLEKVHQRMDKPSSLRRLLKGLFFPIKIKVPLELAGLAATALLVIYIVGIRGKQNVYELAFVQRSQPQTVLQEQATEAGTEIGEETAHREKARPESGFEGKSAEKKDKRRDNKEAIAPRKEESPALAPQERKVDEQNQIEDAVAERKTVKEKEELAKEPRNERTERQTQIEAEAPGVAKAQMKSEPGIELIDREKGVTEQNVLNKPAHREIVFEDIIAALNGKIIEREYNAETQVLESLLIEIPAKAYPNLIQILKERGEILKPYPAINEKDRKTALVRIKLRN